MIPTVATHPNRGHGRESSPAANPTPAQIRATREAADLTQSQAAELIYATLRTWQNWEQESGPEARRMPAAAFELFELKALHPELFSMFQQLRAKRRK
jgi:DNA-binding transcriptional regulator YiaG